MSSSSWFQPKRLAPYLVLATVVLLALADTADSPYLQYRDPIYIAAGFAGVLAACLFVAQPFLVQGRPVFRRWHRLGGAVVVALVIVHVVGLWMTSPPDVIDALLLRSPTPFSVWGVIAMWAVFGLALLAPFRRKLSPLRWRRVHMALMVLIVGGTVIHAVQIEGAMGWFSKWVLCSCVSFLAIRTVVLTRLRGSSRRA